MKRVFGKKAMAAVTAGLMLAAAVPSAALAEETTGEQVQIQENAVTVAVQEETQPILNATDTNGTLTGYTGPGGDVVIPETVGGVKVTGIDVGVWWEHKITSVTIPNGVTEIGFNTFEGCTELKSVTIPNSVTVIGHGAFDGCTSLESITIPSSVVTIGHYSFAGCTGLKAIIISDGVTTIEDGAFDGCTSLKTINIPASVTKISSNAFTGSSFQSITFEGDAPSILDGGEAALLDVSPNTTVYYKSGATGFTSPTWKGLASQMIEGTVSGDTQSSSGSSVVPPGTEIMFADLTPAEQQTAQKKVLGMLGITTAAAGQELFYYDITLVDKATGQACTASNFPKEGITVTIPFPLGKTMYSHNYRLFHFPNGVDGNMVEITPINVTMNGIGFHVNGLSPFVLVAEQNRTSSGGGGNGANVVYNGVKSPKTSDTGCISVIKSYTSKL